MKEGIVADWKLKEVEGISKLVKEYPVVGVLNMSGMPSRQLVQMKKKLGDNAKIRMSRRRLILKALETAKIEGLADKIEGMPALLVAKTDPFKLAKLLRDNKTGSPAKEGSIMPKDIVIPAGETPFPPGPIVGELQMSGVKAAIEGGKVVIKQDSILAKKDEKVNKKKAEVMTKMGIEPMEIGLDLLAVYENGMIYGKEALGITTEDVLAQMQTAASNVFNLTYTIKYPTKDNIEFFIQQAYNEVKNLAYEVNYTCEATVKDLLGKANAQATVLKGLVKEAPAEKKEEAPAKEEKPTEEAKEEEVKPEEKVEEKKEEVKEEKPTEKAPTEEVPAEEKKEEPAAEAVKEETKAEEAPEEEKKEKIPAEEPKQEKAPAEEKVEEKPAEEAPAEKAKAEK